MATAVVLDAARERALELPGLQGRRALSCIDSVEFEFDPQKSTINKAKHGIDFTHAQALWKSKHVLLHAKEALEKRYLVIGKIEGHHWSAIITYRGAVIRIAVGEDGGFPAAEIDTYEEIAG